MNIHSKYLEKYSQIFWDFDGVIKDSLSAKAQSFVEIFKCDDGESLKRISEHHFENAGMSRLQKIPLYMDWCGVEITPDSVNLYSKRFADLVVERVIESPWVEGVHEYILQHFARQRFILVTATPTQEIDYILRALDIRCCFQGVYGSERSKVEAIKLELADENYSTAALIGDGRIDWEAAQSCDIDFILRLTPENHKLAEEIAAPRFGTLKNYE